MGQCQSCLIPSREHSRGPDAALGRQEHADITATTNSLLALRAGRVPSDDNVKAMAHIAALIDLSNNPGADGFSLSDDIVCWGGQSRRLNSLWRDQWRRAAAEGCERGTPA